jgi:hypothetical protein
MTVLNETPHPGNFILSEDDEGRLSRDIVVVASGAGRLLPGTILGKRVADGAYDAAATARAGNTGNGAMTLATPKTGTGVKSGTYTVVCNATAENGGSFRVEDPDGVEVGEVAVGSPFAGPVKFTIADGATDFVAGDAFDIAVTQAAASNKFVASPVTATDGSDVAVAVLVGDVDATSADVSAVAIARHAEVNRHGLYYDASVDDDAKKSAKWAQLRAAGIVVR